ncbi:hypothetical protein CEP53_000098 [Fusarium sp. AF-6]|nr:hypothetical protein CEP53_000098 [Fusarium sp. AF-6]
MGQYSPYRSRSAALGRLERVVGQIETIRKLFQAPSLSVGVYYKGSKLWTKGFGCANLETGLVPDGKTVYSIGSCTKGFTGTALSLLAERGTIDLSNLVSSKISGLKTEQNPVVAKNMTFRDMLSHCAGLSPMPFEVLGRHGQVFAKHEDIVRIFNHLPRAAEFKSEWKYNNWLFALAGTLIVQESHASYGDFIKREILQKIGMKRTYTTSNVDENHALPYLVFDDKDPKAVDLPSLDDGVAFDSSGAIRSCVNDLLLWSRALMRAWRAEQPSRRHHVHQKAGRDLGCLPKLGRIFSRLGKKRLMASMAAAQEPHFPLAGDERQQYALGLFNLHLPTTEMNMVTNPDVNDRNYSIGKDSGERLVIGHTGELGGFLSAFWTFPEDDCAIVVLTNCFQINGDPTNLIAQLLAQTVFEMRPTVDFVEVAKTVVRNARGRWDTIQREWTAHQIPGTSPKLLDAYVGEYQNEGLAMSLSVSQSGDGNYPLSLCINGLESQVFDLYHYHTDSWTFLGETRDDCIEKGYSMYLLSWESWIIKFDHFENGRFRKVKWRLDTDKRLGPQEFLRK